MKPSFKYAMRSDKFNELKKNFNSGEIDVFMEELGKVRKKTLRNIPYDPSKRPIERLSPVKG